MELDAPLRVRIEGLISQAILREEPLAQTSAEEIDRTFRALLPLAAGGPTGPARDFLALVGLAALRAFVRHHHASTVATRVLDGMRREPGPSLREEE